MHFFWCGSYLYIDRINFAGTGINMKAEDVAAIYLRLSKEDMEKEKGTLSSSIENQRNLLEEYAKAHNYKISGIYTDDDYSGLYFERPAFMKMIEDAKMHKFGVILAKSQSRLSRNMEHADYLLHDLLPQLNIRFIGVVDGVDSAVKAGKKARQINALVNEWYSEDLSENIRAVYKRKMRSGEYLGAYPPYGYIKSRNDNHRLEIDEECAIWVRKIYELYLKGYSISDIKKYLEEKKVMTPLEYRNPVKSDKNVSDDNGITCKWSSSTIKRILSNEVYTGLVQQGKCERRSFKDKHIVYLSRDKWITVENMHEPIISKEMYEKVRLLRQERCKRQL